MLTINAQTQKRYPMVLQVHKIGFLPHPTPATDDRGEKEKISLT